MELKNRMELLLQVATEKKNVLIQKLESLKTEYAECHAILVSMEELGLTEDSIEFYWSKKQVEILADKILEASDNLRAFGSQNFTECYRYHEVSQYVRTDNVKENRSPKQFEI